MSGLVCAKVHLLPVQAQQQLQRYKPRYEGAQDNDCSLLTGPCSQPEVCCQVEQEDIRPEYLRASNCTAPSPLWQHLASLRPLQPDTSCICDSPVLQEMRFVKALQKQHQGEPLCKLLRYRKGAFAHKGKPGQAPGVPFPALKPAGNQVLNFLAQCNPPPPPPSLSLPAQTLLLMMLDLSQG